MHSSQPPITASVAAPKRSAAPRQTDSLRQLETRLDQLHAAFTSTKRVGVLNYGTHALFMYADDLVYQKAAESLRVSHLDRWWIPRPVAYPPLSKVYADPAQPLLMRLLAHFWTHGLDASFLEIGCQYGSTAVTVAQFCRQFSRRRVVHVFEPGIAGALAPYNLRLNGVDQDVVFNRTAATDKSRPLVLFSEFGHSENNRIVNRTLENESLSYVTDAIAIDDYVEYANVAPHLILEIDTQGGEIEVWAGLQATIARRTVTAIVEFTPHALEGRIDPAEWLRELARTHIVLDTGSSDAWRSTSGTARIAPIGDSEAFVASVRERPDAYTDLLLIPYTLPHRSALLDLLVPLGSAVGDDRPFAIPLPATPTSPPLRDDTSTLASFSLPVLYRLSAHAVAFCRLAEIHRVVVFGAGGHTRSMIPFLRELGGPEIVAILESQRTRQSFMDIPVLQVGDPLPPMVSGILPSSHLHEQEMRELALRNYPAIPWIFLWEPDRPTVPPGSEPLARPKPQSADQGAAN